MCSRGTLKAVAGNGPPHRQAITSSKLGVGPLLVLVLETWVRVNFVLPTLLASALLPFGIELSLLPNSGSGASTLTLQRQGRLVLGGDQLGGMQHFLPAEEPVWESLYLCPLLMWYPGHGWFVGGPNGGCFLYGDLISGGGWGIPRNSQLSPISKEPLQYGQTTQDNIIGKRNIPFHHLMQFEDRPCQKVRLTQHRQIGPSQPNTVEPGYILWSSSTVPPGCPGRGALHLAARGNLLDGDSGAR